MSTRATNKSYVLEEREIPLVDIVKQIWHNRKFIAIFTMMVVIACLGLAFGSAKYKSEGTYRFGDAIPLEDYNKFPVSFQTIERFKQYIDSSQFEDKNTEEINNLRHVFRSISKQINPIKENNNILGLHITLKDAKPEVAQKMVELLGYYVMDSIIYDAYADSILVELDRNNTRANEIDNAIIIAEEKQGALQRTQSVLQHIIRKYPNAAESRSQQVIFIDEESVRYLAPTTQLIAVELTLSELDEEIQKLKREARQLKIQQEFYRKAQQLHKDLKSGRLFLTGVPTILHEVFQDKDLDNNEVKEIFNSLSMEYQRAESLYLEKSRFVAGPTLPQHSTARLGLTVAGSAFAGLFLSLIFVLGRHWWKENMRTDVSK